MIDERLEDRLDADADVLQNTAQERRLQQLIKPNVESRMKKIFPHHFGKEGDQKTDSPRDSSMRDSNYNAVGR